MICQKEKLHLESLIIEKLGNIKLYCFQGFVSKILTLAKKPRVIMEAIAKIEAKKL